MSATLTDTGIEVLGRPMSRSEEILTPAAIEFLDGYTAVSPPSGMNASQTGNAAATRSATAEIRSSVKTLCQFARTQPGR